MTSSRGSPKAGAVAALSAAALLLMAEAILFDHLGFRERLLSYDLVAHDHPNAGETKLFLLQMVLGVPALLLICGAGLKLLPPRQPDLLARLAGRPRRTYVVLAIAAATFIVLVRVLVFRGAAFTDDERVYVYESRALLAGGLTTQAPGPLQIFSHQFLLELPGGRWGGVYPIGQPTLLAVSRTLGVPFLTQALSGAGIVYLAARLAERLWNAKVGVGTALLLATSPFLICMSATLHSMVPSTFLLLAVLAASLSARDAGGYGSYALVGAALGAMQLTRQLEALLAALAAGLLLAPLVLRSDRDRKRHAIGLLIVFTLCVVSLFIQFETNAMVTGDPMVNAYSAFARRWPGAKMFGFGNVGWGVTATFPGAISKTFAVLMRLSAWCFGWPGSLLPLGLVALGVGSDRWSRAAIAFVLVQATAYFFLGGGAVHDIGSAYHLFDLPFIAMVTAVVVIELGDRLTPLGTIAQATPARLAFAAFAVGLTTFWPQELARLGHVARTIRAPLEAAEAYAEGGPIALFWERMQPPGAYTSWVYFPPPPGPRLDDPVLWVRSGPWEEQVREAYPSRKPCRLQWEKDRPIIVPF